MTDDAPILIVDDSLTVRMDLARAFEAAGLRTIACGSAQAAREAVAQQPVALMVLDVLLPDGDGVELLGELRAVPNARGAPALMLSTEAEVSARIRGLQTGAEEYVGKPYDTSYVVARAQQLLRPLRGEQSVQRKILAIDDSISYVQSLGDALRGQGYDVALARSGEEALELLALQPVDCILLDPLMPGLGGEETCKRIKAVSTIRCIPLIIVTELEDRDATIAGLVAGADDYISKASELDVLQARVLAQTRRKQFEDENRKIREELLQKRLEAIEARARELAETRAVLVEELESKNRELEALSYSVSHDLRAPLRSIDGFSKMLIDDHSEQLDADGQHYLRRVRASAQRMGELIDALLELSRIGRVAPQLQSVDLSALARVVLGELRRADPERSVRGAIEDGILVEGDPRLLRIVLENLFGNAWKFSAQREAVSIDFGVAAGGPAAYFVKDAGAGFDASYAEKLFRPFQRLHAATEFPGTGIGLATVARIVGRHGGRIWAESEPDRGATFYFTLRTPAATG